MKSKCSLVSSLLTCLVDVRLEEIDKNYLNKGNKCQEVIDKDIERLKRSTGLAAKT